MYHRIELKVKEPQGEEPDQSMSSELNTGYIVMGVGENDYGEFSPYWYATLCIDETAASNDGNQLTMYNWNYAENEAFFGECYWKH